MKLSNNLYNVLKYICLIALPAISVFYFALSKIWGLPYATEVCGTISAICVLMGSLLKISTDQYNKDVNK